MPEITCACNKMMSQPAAWERIRAFLLRYHGTKEVDTETLRAVLRMAPEEEDPEC